LRAGGKEGRKVMGERRRSEREGREGEREEGREGRRKGGKEGDGRIASEGGRRREQSIMSPAGGWGGRGKGSLGDGLW